MKGLFALNNNKVFPTQLFTHQYPIITYTSNKKIPALTGISLTIDSLNT